LLAILKQRAFAKSARLVALLFLNSPRSLVGPEILDDQIALESQDEELIENGFFSFFGKSPKLLYKKRGSLLFPTPVCDQY